MGVITRDYDQYCPLARALDILGERWAALVLRELLLGPQRFTDLRARLPGISSNTLTERLKRLEAGGVVTKRMVPPPVASTVYELAPDPELCHLLAAMATWGLTSPGSAVPARQITSADGG